MTLNKTQAKELGDAVRHRLEPYFRHQGWESLEQADRETSNIIALLRSAGVKL